MKEFPPFRLDIVNQCLWCRDEGADEQRILLTPKAFAMLRYLVERSGRLVTQDEMLEALWPETFVQPEVLKSHIRDIRNALRDDPKNARFIETLPRRGYRFIAPVTDDSERTNAEVTFPARKIVGRSEELEQLRGPLRRALRGERQLVFVTGEPGIGKTTLVDEFQRYAAADTSGLRVARGQCVEGFGGQEPYYPMLEALGQFCRGPAADSVVPVLTAQAPTWLVQFPALVKREQRERLQREIIGATRERMLREISDALETITSESPLLLLFEDMQWADRSSIDLISALARRRQPAKLLLIGTYRPVDVLLADHPLKALKQDLLVHHLCHEIALEPLDEAEVAEYLAAESGGATVPEGLAGLICRHSEGNPLFMVAALNSMCDRGLIALENGSWQFRAPLEKIDVEAPETLRQMIELRIERLSPDEQRLLEIASVIRRYPVSVTIGAAVSNLQPDTVEELLEGLARRHQIMRPAGFRDYKTGTSPCYEFVHVLYSEVMYGRIGVARKRKLHQSVAEAAEALVVSREADVVAGFAYQFEEGGDWPRAVKYLLLAADTAGGRFEPRQAAEILEHALKLAERIPEEQRVESEIAILQELAPIYSALYDPRAIQTYEALAATAAHSGLADLEALALIEVAWPLAMVGADAYERGLERAHDALSRCREAGTPERVALRVNYLCNRMATGRWEPGDLDECKEAVRQLRERCEPRLLGKVQLRLAYFLRNFAEYGKAVRSADEGFVILLQGFEENPYLTAEFHLHEDVVGTSLVLLGQWGEALQRIDRWTEVVKKNGDRAGVEMARLVLVPLYLEAMDFAAARQVLDSAFPILGALPLLRRYLLVHDGSLQAGTGNADTALELLQVCRAEMEQNPLLVDWYLRMPLQRSLTEAWLSKGDLAQARVEADEFLRVTLVTQERTFRALAFEANARVSMAERDLPRAQDCTARAVQEMEGYEVPLAHWRVHATAYELFQRMKQRDAAKKHRELSRATIMKLANSLPVEEPLRQIFLSAPMVRSVLGDELALANKP
jgi:DNA-binding winged helix-turn-helix (wHTH) protein